MKLGIKMKPMINGPMSNFPHTQLPINGAQPNMVNNQSLRGTLHKMDVIDPDQSPKQFKLTPKPAVPFKKAPYTA